MNSSALKFPWKKLSTLSIFSVWPTTWWLHSLLNMWIFPHQTLLRDSALTILPAKPQVSSRPFTSDTTPSEPEPESGFPTSRSNSITSIKTTSRLKNWRATQSFKIQSNQQWRLPDNCWATNARTENFAGSDLTFVSPERWTDSWLKTRQCKKGHLKRLSWLKC